MDPARLLIANGNHRHFDRNDALLAVIENDLLADLFRCDQLPDEPIILDVDVKYQAIHLKVSPNRSTHECTERGHLDLADAASDSESSGARTEHAANLDWL